MIGGAELSAKKGRTPPKPEPAPTPKLPAEWRRHVYFILTIWALALIAYSNSFHAELTLDNRPAIQDDPRIRTAAIPNVHAIWSSGYWMDNSSPDLYRPLTTLSYLFNYSVLGNRENPLGYHWINFLLHAANALLVYCVALAVFRDSARSLALAALWAAHPVLTESVTNIVGRADMLAAGSVLLGLLCHRKAVSSAGAPKAAWLAALALAGSIGMFSKESAVVLIAVLVAYDLAFRTDAIRASLPSYAAAILPVALFLFRRSQVVATLPLNPTTFLNNPLLGIGFLPARLTAIQVLGGYLWRILWPQSLSCDYSYNQVPLWGNWTGILAVLAVLALAVLMVAAYRRTRPVAFFIAFFFIALAPVANIALLIGTIMAERFLYLPAVGIVGCAVWAIYSVFGRGGLIRPAWIVGLLCLCLLARTYVRNADWQTSGALWSSAAAVSPGSYKTHMNLSLALFRESSNLDRAIAEGERAVAILQPLPLDRDEDPAPYINLGSYYRVKGDLLGHADPSGSSSRQFYRKSLDTLLRGRAVDRARSAMLMRLNTRNGRRFTMIGVYQLYQELAETYLRLGEPGNAVSELEYGTALSPQTADLFQIMSEAYTALHDRDGAAIALMEGLIIEPEQPKFASGLVDLYRTGPSGCAIGAGGSTLNLACPLVRQHLCAAAGRVRDLYLRRDMRADARKVRDTAVQTFGCPMPQ
jgi:tetratricopeptide (TPR) repeat protein